MTPPDVIDVKSRGGMCDLIGRVSPPNWRDYYSPTNYTMHTVVYLYKSRKSTNYTLVTTSNGSRMGWYIEHEDIVDEPLRGWLIDQFQYEELEAYIRPWAPKHIDYFRRS